MSALPRFHDLRRGDAFGKGKVRFDDERPSKNNDEEHAQEAADEHDGGAFPIVDLIPRPRDHERGNGKDRAGNERFTDRRRGAGDVFFEDGSAKRSERSHGDDRCWKRGGHREPCFHSEVRIGGAQHDRHQHAEKHRLECELR